LNSVQKAISEYDTFVKMITMKAFSPFPNPEVALENLNSISDGFFFFKKIINNNKKYILGEMNEFLEKFLETNLKGKKIKLGVQDQKLGGNISQNLEIKCFTDQTIAEITRGLKLFFHKFLKHDLETEVKAQLGLGHSYSRFKVKYNINKSDNMVKIYFF
jgi:nucleolar protein 56